MMGCYATIDGITQPATHNPISCGSYTSAVPHYCCASGDFCVGYSICHFTHPDPEGSSGYYIGGCTDETFSSAACSKECCELSQVYISRATVYLTDLLSG